MLCVTSKDAFNRFITARFPKGLDVDVRAIPDRATAVVTLADAKAIRQGVGEGIFIRSANPDIEIRSLDDGTSIPVSELTIKAGGIGIHLSPDRTWTFVGNIAVVENADAFWCYEIVLPDVDLAILGSGNMSSRLLQWLASPAMAQCRITHWGDYDPVGVCEYVRLVDACPARVETYTPATVDELLPKFGKRKLVIDQAKYLDRLRRRAFDPHVGRMIDLFDKYRRGLEQEVLLYRGDVTFE